jgi:hypothetical protein
MDNFLGMKKCVIINVGKVEAVICLIVAWTGSDIESWMFAVGI